MNRPVLITIALLVALVALPASARHDDPLADIVRMHDAGVSEETILDWVSANQLALDLSASDVTALARAGFSDVFIRGLIDETGANRKAVRESRSPTALYYPPGYYNSYYYDTSYYPSWLYFDFYGGHHSYGGHAYSGHHSGGYACPLGND